MTNTNFLILICVVALFAGWTFLYGFAWNRGWNEARSLYKPLLDDAWKREDEYRTMLVVLNGRREAK